MPQNTELGLIPLTLDYRCRRCDKRFSETVEVEDRGGLAPTLRALLLTAANGMGHSPRAHVHECPTIYGGVGIADLVGGTLKGES
jgi:hypothetical protein